MQPHTRISRRGFLGTTAALGASVLLEACGSKASTGTGTSTGSSTTAAASGGPKRGGDLRIGLTGGSSSDTLYPLAQVTTPDLARSPQLFNSLVQFDQHAQLVLVLAEEMTPNHDATQWTIRLKKGIMFHNGKELGADDVVFTFQRCLNPKSPAPSAALLVPVDLAGVKALDNYTVRVPCKTPFSALPQMLQNYNMPIMPVGFDLAHPVGTGPFKFQQFTPGVQSTFVRNPDYFEHGLPYVDSVTITDYSDEASMVNALLSNQEDAIGAISVDSVVGVQSGGKTIVYSDAGGITPFTMRCDVPPFNDVRVRQAMRLIVDRPQMRELVFGGHGLLGNDVTSPFDPAYDHSLPQRAQDIAQAKHLLKTAGRADLKLELVTAPIAQGTVQAATVLAQQAKAAGVDIQIRNTTTSTFFGPDYLKWEFAQDFYYYSPYMLQVADSFVPSSPYNETHFDESQYNTLWSQAQRTTTQAALTPIEHQMMTIDYEQGGYIIPYFVPVIDGHDPKLQGVQPSNTGAALRNFEFKYFWFA